MEQDIRRLRELPRTADRIAMKRDELLPRWLPTVENYLAEGEVYANPIFAWCVIWLFDVGILIRRWIGPTWRSPSGSRRRTG